MNRELIETGTLEDGSELKLYSVLDECPINPVDDHNIYTYVKLLENDREAYQVGLSAGNADIGDLRDFITSHGENQVAYSFSTQYRNYTLIGDFDKINEFTGACDSLAARKRKKHCARATLEACAKELKFYFEGDCYGYVLELNNENIDSFWGFFTDDPEKVLREYVGFGDIVERMNQDIKQCAEMMVI